MNDEKKPIVELVVEEGHRAISDVSRADAVTSFVAC